MHSGLDEDGRPEEQAGLGKPATLRQCHEVIEAQALRPMPSHALSPAERAALLTVANEPRFAAVPPARIVPMLADEGVYLGSESSLARVLKAHGQNARRGRAKAPKATRQPTTHIATAPGQVWCWDMSAPWRRDLQRQREQEDERQRIEAG